MSAGGPHIVILNKDWKPSRRDYDLEEFYYPDDNERCDISIYDKIPVTVAGKYTVDPINSFDLCNLHEGLVWVLDKCKYKKPTLVQQYTIPMIARGKDLVCISETGSGKTAAYLIPIIDQIFKNPPKKILIDEYFRPLVLILCPTRELCAQIHKEATRLTYRSFVKCAKIHGGHKSSDQAQGANGALIITCTPGRICDMYRRQLLDLGSLQYIVLDELDKMLDQGFSSTVIDIIFHFGAPKDVKKLLLSATLPLKTQSIVMKILGTDFSLVTIGKIGKISQTVEQVILKMREDIKFNTAVDIIRELMGSNPLGALIVLFVNRKLKVSEILGQFLKAITKAVIVPLHGLMSQHERKISYETFLKSKFGVLVTTDVSQRGLDIQRIMAVINYDMPSTIETYVHRIGRVARVGRRGTAFSFFTNKDYLIAYPLIELLESSVSEIPPFLQRFRNKAGTG